MNSPLSHWLRLLWGTAPPLHLNSEAPWIAGGAIHLPARSRWQQHRAAAAHAAAHLVYSPTRFDGRGLGPVVRALLALLEDARVEALVCRELPGLARLWRSLHTATRDDGTDFEALMRRLARALADRDYDDPHPWVCKGRSLFYLDASLGLLALRTPAELRNAASQLGHDIGQMRLQFNAKTYRPAPAYRDDHRWMWDADDVAVDQAPTESVSEGGDATPDPDDASPDVFETVTHHPEWDRLIARLRLDWCRVIEHEVPTAAARPVATDPAVLEMTRRLHGPLRPLTRNAAARLRGEDGEVLDIDALVQSRIANRLRGPIDTRVYRALPCRAASTAVWVLVDQSASTAVAHGSSGRTVLQSATQSAAAIVLTLQAMGVACAVAGFHSNGRQAVHVHVVKRLCSPIDYGALTAGLQSLRSADSTRLGAALRHATTALAAHRDGPRWVLLLSDGQPHDIDVHDPSYLLEDARAAVREAARRSVRIACVALAVDADTRRIFGGKGMQNLVSVDDLPRALQRLLT